MPYDNNGKYTHPEYTKRKYNQGISKKRKSNNVGELRIILPIPPPMPYCKLSRLPNNIGNQDHQFAWFDELSDKIDTNTVDQDDQFAWLDKLFDQDDQFAWLDELFDKI